MVRLLPTLHVYQFHFAPGSPEGEVTLGPFGQWPDSVVGPMQVMPKVTNDRMFFSIFGRPWVVWQIPRSWPVLALLNRQSLKLSNDSKDRARPNSQKSQVGKLRGLSPHTGFAICFDATALDRSPCRRISSFREITCVVAPVSSRAFLVSINSTCSKPSVARIATRLPCRIPFVVVVLSL
jgi:hypothetical protein